ncbi:uncharacterized protein LOC113360919 [Papaver somniferum]|uniref:uncharacterized protein LOC113360919 n=1 Tax=Papaver somniferum TaxID=3469 RepID=UPI000E6F517E|nr:uncharacterized protein LOC113360919 [Papaver somniferum]
MTRLHAAIVFHCAGLFMSFSANFQWQERPWSRYQQKITVQYQNLWVQLMDLAGAADGFLKASFHVEVTQLFMTREGTGATHLKEKTRRASSIKRRIQSSRSVGGAGGHKYCSQ